MRWVVAAGSLVALALWSSPKAREASPPQAAPAEPAEVAISFVPATPLPEPPRDEQMHAVQVAGDLEIYVVQAARDGRRTPVVFLTGSCTSPLTYLRAFRHAAAEHGGIVALQGDQPCKGDPSLRRWSADASATSARIDAALLAAGAAATDDLTLMGYSQGAERAEWLAQRFPVKYTRFVLVAGPVVPTPSRFAGARAIATLAGYGDVRENMADGARRLRRASIPATYIELPGTHHGDLGPEVDAFVGRALDWVDENAIVRAADNASVTPTHARHPRHRTPQGRR